MPLRDLLTAAAAVPAARPGMDLPPGLAHLRARRAEREAAVLVAVVAHPGRPCVLLTRRTDHLDDHAGQISFPGGRVEDTDRGAVEAALREAQEEIGLAPGQVEVLGTLSGYHTITNFRVTPVLGLVEPGYELVVDRHEVAEVFEVPLAVLRDPIRRQRLTHDAFGAEISYWAYEYDGRLIWGATAAMLVDLCERLDAVSET